MSTCASDRPLEIVVEDLLEPLQESIELLLRLSNHLSSAGFKAIGK
jgi:hypothetical protein